MSFKDKEPRPLPDDSIVRDFAQSVAPKDDIIDGLIAQKKKNDVPHSAAVLPHLPGMSDVEQLAEIRIRQWMMEQEKERRKNPPHMRNKIIPPQK